MKKTSEVSKFHSEVAKKMHKNKPRNKEFYQNMQKRSVLARLAKKDLST